MYVSADCFLIRYHWMVGISYFLVSKTFLFHLLFVVLDVIWTLILEEIILTKFLFSFRSQLISKSLRNKDSLGVESFVNRVLASMLCRRAQENNGDCYHGSHKNPASIIRYRRISHYYRVPHFITTKPTLTYIYLRIIFNYFRNLNCLSGNYLLNNMHTA